MSDAIKIDGLTQFAKRIKQVDTELPKMLRKTLNVVAGVVVDATRPNIPSRSGKARASVKAASLRDAVRVKAGGTKAPWYPWLDYGGEGRIKGRPPKRPFIKSGRYLYPAYFKKRDSGELLELANKGLLEVVEAAGLEVS